jgi:transposase
MQQSLTFVGIDVSKLTLDICVIDDNNRQYVKISNNAEAIEAFFIKYSHGRLCIGMENTGCYNYYLYEVLAKLKLEFYVIPPLHLKKSIGLSRGKNDKIDSHRIAAFLEVNQKKLTVYRPQSPAIKQLQLWLGARNTRIKLKKQTQQSEEVYAFTDTDTDSLKQMNQQIIAMLEEQIKKIEKQIQQLIGSIPELSVPFKLITSIQGVGNVLAWHLLVRTNGFTTIDSARKMACYAGVAPFEYSSGTSIRGKAKVSHFADKGLKTLLHLAAMSAIRLTGDLKNYYQRKVQEGKSKMSVINAVRNKIIHRIYAVLKRQTPYQIFLSPDLVMS